MNYKDKRELEELQERAEKLLKKIEDKPTPHLSDWEPVLAKLAVSLIALGITASVMNKIIKKSIKTKKKKDGRKHNNK